MQTRCSSFVLATDKPLRQQDIVSKCVMQRSLLHHHSYWKKSIILPLRTVIVSLHFFKWHNEPTIIFSIHFAQSLPIVYLAKTKRQRRRRQWRSTARIIFAHDNDDEGDEICWINYWNFDFKVTQLHYIVIDM